MTIQLQIKKPENKQVEPFKIFVGGSQLDRWKSEEQIKKAKDVINSILNYSSGNLLPQEFVWSDNRLLQTDKLIKFSGSLTVLSGHCPVGEEKSYCVTCESWCPLPYGTLSHVGYKPPHKFVRVYDKGGVDTWVEIIAKKLGIPVELHPAPAKDWNDKEGYKCGKCGTVMESSGYPISTQAVKHVKETGHMAIHFDKIKLLGYRSRNLEMTVADIGYAIEAAGSCWRCGGKGEISLLHEDLKRVKSMFPQKCPWCKGLGARSGATFVVNKMNEQRKEGYIIVI